jgi:hypothetical protein
VKLEKNAEDIGHICERGQHLLQQLEDESIKPAQVFDLIREMHMLDQAAVKWRAGPEWSFKTVQKADLIFPNDIDDETREAIAGFPEALQLHRDVWTAYEWNYHRTARTLMHKQLLACLRRAAMADTEDGEDSAAVEPLEYESLSIIRSLADRVLSTVPQVLGDVDAEGRVIAGGSPRCRAVGAYLLLVSS